MEKEETDSVKKDSLKEPPTADDGKETYGFELYPDRRKKGPKGTWKEAAFYGTSEVKAKQRCEEYVWNVMQTSPTIKLFLSALKSAGCELDARRHISCENCNFQLLGGYDAELNQVVICQNVCEDELRVETALAHELVHMFDRCRSNLDFKNIDHLACTEIRAAALTSCSYKTSMTLRTRDYFKIAETHKDCVRKRAFMSVKPVRNVTDLEAWAAVYRVFPRCYNDLEPIGRHPRHNSVHFEWAYRSRFFYGYDS